MTTDPQQRIESAIRGVIDAAMAAAGAELDPTARDGLAQGASEQIVSDLGLDWERWT